VSDAKKRSRDNDERKIDSKNDDDDDDRENVVETVVPRAQAQQDSIRSETREKSKCRTLVSFDGASRSNGKMRDASCAAIIFSLDANGNAQSCKCSSEKLGNKTNNKAELGGCVLAAKLVKECYDKTFGVGWPVHLRGFHNREAERAVHKQW
jgi:hypothetical protein